MPVLAVTPSCVGCGYCEAICPTKAIRADGVARIDEEKCKAFTRRATKSGTPSCLICVRYCPVKGALVQCALEAQDAKV